MITREEIYQKAAEAKVDPGTIEKDYHLGIVLKAISKNPMSRDWVFRGGTALRKCYFPNYRFSEDLDFSLINRSLGNEDKISDILRGICRKSNEQFGTTLEYFNLTKEREEYGEEAFKGTLHFQGIKGKSKIKVDLSFADKVFVKPVEKTILHGYSDNNVFRKPKIKTARLEEIIADKFMAVSFIRSYPRNRDLFDIWYIADKKKLDSGLIEDVFGRKSDFRKLDEKLVYQINQAHLSQFEKYWKAQLTTLVGDLPRFEEVVERVIDYRNSVFGKK